MRINTLTLFITLLITVLPVLQSSAQTVHNVWDPPYRQGIAAEVENKIITFEEIRREIGDRLLQKKLSINLLFSSFHYPPPLKS